ncbi:TSC22 domain family protein 2-like isoform X2 [Mugil cephalus]|uniref:TSC22 domain family protein 2-like isoform X2 n=1 Tax=Mugil cephalus TaxID=48193 RepID=UPI001FB7F3DC|nr:TSC22 domain family protein 2-like isoform X2 [Mugil cephalus]
MSKMPAKKKSCFQITSVTQAQTVAATGAADDTESLDDPDESRTEDLSRAEYEPAGDRSSSEEALNNVGELEVDSVVAPPNVPQASQLSSNPVGDFRKVGVSGSYQGVQQPPGIGLSTGLPLIAQPGAMQQQLPAPTGSAGPAGVSVNTSQPAVTSSAAPPATSTVSCTSRFRVIKLDHGTGEPFRRGRWTCTEFYEKDSEGSVVSRTVDSIRHTSVTLDPAADRDSGLGLTGGSAVAPATYSGQGLGSMADTSISSTRMHSVETLSQQQQQIHHQNYSARSQGVSGSATHSTFSSIKPTAVPAQAVVGGLQPPPTQTVLPVGQNGLPQSGVHTQKSPIMPPTAQPIAYPQQQQVPVGHHLTSQSPGLMQNQTEYYQQQQSTSMPPGLVTGQSLPVSSPSAVPQPVGQGPTTVMPPASGGASVPSHIGDVAGAGVGSVPAGQPAPSILQQQMGGAIGSILVGGATLQQPTVSPYAAAGQPQPHGHLTSSGVQNVPAIAVSSSVPTTVPTAVPSASSAAMPNVTTPSLPPGQNLLMKSPLAFGAHGLPAIGFGQMEGGRKSEGLINTQSPVVSGKEPVKPFMPESLQLTTPTVNSLFGIHIPVDGEEDSASGTNVVAIDNKIEQAMDLVKSHLMYAVREEVEVLKEQIKELYERNSVLERENAVLKSLANSEQLSQLSSQSATSSGATPPLQGLSQPLQQAQPPLQIPPQPQSHPQLQHHPKPQQLQTQPQLDPGQQQQQQQQQQQPQPNVTSA